MMGGFRERGVGPISRPDLQPAIADDQLAGEGQNRREAGRAKRLLRRNRNAANPEAAQPLVAGTFPDPREQRAQDSVTPVRRQREAVPDVALTRTRCDGQLELADPLRLSGQPAVPGELTVHPHPETAAPPRHARRDEVSFGAHGRGDQESGNGVDLSYFAGRRRLIRPSGASRHLPARRGGQIRRPESASNQMAKWRCRILSITSGSPVADPPGYRPKNVRTRSCGESNVNRASAPSKLAFSGSGVHLPSLTVMRHLPPHGPATSIP